MNRRKFLGGLFGAFIAPKILSETTVPVVAEKAAEYETLGFTGTEIVGGRYIYAPYIPIIRNVEYQLTENIKRDISSEIDQEFITKMTWLGSPTAGGRGLRSPTVSVRI